MFVLDVFGIFGVFQVRFWVSGKFLGFSSYVCCCFDVSLRVFLFC